MNIEHVSFFIEVRRFARFVGFGAAEGEVVFAEVGAPEAEIGCANRLVGSEGVLEIRNERPHVRLRGRGDAEWQPVETGEGIHGESAIEAGVADLVEALESGREPELAAWLPPEPELKRLALRVDELRTSPLALSPEQQADALRERIRSQAEEFFDPARRRLYARRLWAVAPALERRGATHAAAVVRATARRMFHNTSGLLPSFAEQLFGKVLALMARPAGSRAPSPAAGTREEGAGAASAPESAPGERRSPGGLILP